MASDASSAADRTLVMERVFRATPERVFQAWTDPAVLASTTSTALVGRLTEKTEPWPSSLDT